VKKGGAEGSAVFETIVPGAAQMIPLTHAAAVIDAHGMNQRARQKQNSREAICRVGRRTSLLS